MFEVKTQYEYIFEKYGEKLYRLLVAYCKNTADSEDILQNAFLKLHMTNQKFETEEHVKNWLYKIAINEAKNLLKRELLYRNKIQEIDVGQIPEQSIEIYECIQKLPAKYRIVILLYYYEEYSIKEIASILKRKESTIQTQLQRGREMLKKFMEGNKNV